MNRMMKIIAGGFFLSAAITAHADANLIKNGTFDDVTVPTSGTGTSSAWGAYVYAPGFRCANWTFYNSNFKFVVSGGRLALSNSKPSGTFIFVR